MVVADADAMDDEATPSIWHAGEREMQRAAGVAGTMDAVGRRNVRDSLPEQHRLFFAQLPFLVLGSVDAASAPWATTLAGDPGFVGSPSPNLLEIGARPEADDPAGEGMGVGAAIGLLGIEPHTRRRNRVNGTVRTAAPGRLGVAVEQSFGNCPQYIALRDLSPVVAPPAPRAAETMDALDGPAREAIAAADVFFVASFADLDGGRQVDVSHRGGRSGFVRVDPDGTLTIPDFAGNRFFMTLGNVLLSGKAGLVFPNWATGDLLQLTGDAAILSDAAETAAFRGAERLWTVRPRRIVRRRGVLPLRWSTRADGASPNTLMTGDWREAASRRAVAATGPAVREAPWRSFKVARIVDESRSIRSFYLRPADGAELAPALAGQHLTIRLTLPGRDGLVARSYTVSGTIDGAYRISVKRDGSVSRHLHGHVAVGDIVEVAPPAGDFTIDARERRPAVLLAGGIGITPLLAMLRHLVEEGRSTGTIRPATLFYAVREKVERAFDGELAALAEAAGGAIRVVRVLGSTAGARAGVDYEAAGRIDVALLAEHLRFGAYDFYLCGPPAFAQTLYDGLRGSDVPDERILAEGFGPSALQRSRDAGPARPSTPPAAGPVRVAFATSGSEAEWTPASGSLLDLAEASGLAPVYGCRSGTCGTCRTRIVAGEVAYAAEPGAGRSEGEALICCAAPTAGTAELILEL